VFGLSLFSENMSANEIDVKSERDQVKRKNVGRPRAFPRRANCILWFDRSSNIVCFRENMAHKCSLDFSDHQMPYKKNRVSPASISDFLFRSRRMDNRGEDYYSRARFHLDPNIYVEDSCFGIIPPIPDCLIASKEYVLKNWINESSKYFKVSAVSCYPSWEDSTFRQCRWKIKCQVGNNIYAMVGYGSIRVLFFMFRRIDGYVLRKLPSELSVECGGAMCVNCQKGVVREEVLLMAALFVLRSVRGELNPFPLPRVHSKLLDFNRDERNGHAFRPDILHSLRPLLDLTPASPDYPRLVAAIICLEPHDFVILSLRYNGKCVTFESVLDYSSRLVRLIKDEQSFFKIKDYVGSTSVFSFDLVYPLLLFE